MMYKPQRWSYVIGIALLLMGGLLLLQSLGLIPGGGWLWSLLFLVGGGAFLSVVFSGKHNWWAVIPGVVLLMIGVIIVLSSFAPEFSESYSGTIFLGGLALTFLIIYLINVQNWWALIPSGVLATLAVVTVLETTGTFEIGTIFFLGLALTFSLLALLPTGGERMTWPWYPAGALLLVGALVSIGAEGMINYIWPAALILAGIIVLTRSFRK